MTITTDYIILKKTPYKETSLILTGISKDTGRTDLLVKGALKTASKNLPTIDIFREIRISLNPEKHALQPIYSAELISNFDSLADNTERFEAACEISKFLIANLHSGVPAPETYRALKTALQSLINLKKNCFFQVTLVKMIFLKELGMLPATDEQADPEAASMLEQLLTAASGRNNIPNISSEYMKLITSWTDNICQLNELK
jgi:DNA repair protein RecO